MENREALMGQGSTDTTRPTPWGRADYQWKLAPGVAWVNTPGHGGFMISRAWAKKNLTEAAQKRGEHPSSYGFLVYEEDCDAAIVFFEHTEFGRALGMKDVETNAWLSLSYWHIGYLRERGIEPDQETVLRKEAFDSRFRGSILDRTKDN